MPAAWCSRGRDGKCVTYTEATHGVDTGIFFHCCQGYFNEIGPFLVDGRDNGAGAISTLVRHAWHAAVGPEAQMG